MLRSFYFEFLHRNTEIQATYLLGFLVSLLTGGRWHQYSSSVGFIVLLSAERARVLIISRNSLDLNKPYHLVETDLRDRGNADWRLTRFSTTLSCGLKKRTISYLPSTLGQCHPLVRKERNWKKSPCTSCWRTYAVTILTLSHWHKVVRHMFRASTFSQLSFLLHSVALTATVCFLHFLYLVVQLHLARYKQPRKGWEGDRSQARTSIVSVFTLASHVWRRRAIVRHFVACYDAFSVQCSVRVYTRAQDHASEHS